MSQELASESLMENGSFWFPTAASDLAPNTDLLFNFILYSSLILFIGLIAAVVIFLVKYKETDENKVAEKQISHSTSLEIIWSVIPLILVLIIFFWGFKDYVKTSVSPPNALNIHVTGKKWFWQFEYPKQGIQTVNEIVVPINTPVRLVMSSYDVIHSFYLPNFRQKRDVIPNRYTTLWFEANKMGNFQIFCTEYCGDAHSTMLATLRVVSDEEYKEWLDEAASAGDDLPLDQLGEKLYTNKGCNACHSIDGVNGVGPTWKNIYGTKRALTNGQSVTIDEAYLRESMMEPNAKVVAGYPPVMPTYQGLLKDREVNALIEYIKALKD